MQTGRPFSGKRTPFGQRIRAAREALGLSQAQVAAKLNVNQASYGAWEREPVALRPEQIEELAQALNVTVDYLFGRNNAKSRGTGPVGRARRAFETLSSLPRHQQQKIVEVVETLIAGQQSKAA